MTTQVQQRVRIVSPGPAVDGRDILPERWYRHKVAEVQVRLKDAGYDALLLFSATNIIYGTGFHHYSTERPLACLLPQSGAPALFVPELEVDALKGHWVTDVESYFDFPGEKNRIEWVGERLAKRGLGKATIATEELRPSSLERLRAALPNATFKTTDVIDTMRYVKDADEIAMIRRACYFADLLCEAGRQFIEENGAVSEVEILQAVCQSVSTRMQDELTDAIGVGLPSPYGGLVPFGKRSALPHAIPSTAHLQAGDALILSFGASVGGYGAESERAFAVAPVSDHAKRLFDAMVEAQDTAIAGLRAGRTCGAVDKEALDTVRAKDLGQFLKHRTGHAIGLEGHEPPWLEEGDATVLKEGMVFTIEPGVYDPSFGGFRHSDTVVVRAGGGETLNQYPRRLADMTITL